MIRLSLHNHGKRIMDQSEFHQAMLERQQMVEEALSRAEQGTATEDDWKVIYYECGIQRRKSNGSDN